MWRDLYCAAFLLALPLSLAPAAEAEILAQGEFELMFSLGPGDPNFNSALTASHIVPPDFGPTAGMRLVVSLRDSSRPNQFCDPDDPFGGLFEGCAAVDWPFPGRRGINLVDLELDAAGLQTFHLRMSDEITAEEEPEGP